MKFSNFTIPSYDAKSRLYNRRVIKSMAKLINKKKRAIGSLFFYFDIFANPFVKLV